MNISKPIALLILTGSLLFLIASFSPISRVHMAATAAEKLAIITEENQAWLFAQVLYTLGALLTASGIGLAALQIHRQARSGLWLPVFVGMAAGFLFFGAYVIFRTVNPQAWVEIVPPHPQFLVYTLLTQAGLFLFGLMLRRDGYPGWLSWLVVGSMAIVFILTIIFRDMPPFAYYLLSLTIAIVILIKKPEPKITVRNRSETSIA
jgi:hypothetical protein